MNRRDFLRLLAGSAAVGALSRCAPATLSPEPPLSTLPSEPEPTLTAAPTSTPKPAPRLLDNENRKGFYIRYYTPFESVDPQQWMLEIGGKVHHNKRLSFTEMQKLPLAAQNSRMVCVEGWSSAAKWEGFAPQTLVELVEPQPDATWVHFHSADGYYESLALGEFLMDRILLAYRMNDALLLPEYGAPLRLIVPAKYGYKGPKAITRIVFADEELRGYWPTVGGYSTEGQIWPGPDYALDLGKQRKIPAHGEVFYDDGVEAQDKP
ncbi:MAG TPA: molybdopterin-dependent oxidoreductase [Anaerolineae bacterium]|nr:molybdopterin-dependent oxidoreductase [Anaerolineae bacterium]HQI85479.1 molybdopterin-dependent oxidoreductase [Anaerolineae bacterium]